MMEWAREKAFNFMLSNRHIVYCHRVNVRSRFDWHDKKSGPALRSLTEQDGAE